MLCKNHLNREIKRTKTLEWWFCIKKEYVTTQFPERETGNSFSNTSQWQVPGSIDFPLVVHRAVDIFVYGGEFPFNIYTLCRGRKLFSTAVFLSEE